MALGSEASEQEALDAVLQHGAEAVSFQVLEPAIRRAMVVDDAGGGEPVGVVCYAVTGSAWVAAGSPLASPENLRQVAQTFVAEARAHKRRASFFATEDPECLGVTGAIAIGAQPIFNPSEWAERLSGARRLREQLRRARAKGVVIRPLSAEELAEGTDLRFQVEALGDEWLRSRHMAAMGFLVSLELFVRPERHRYYAAMIGDRVVAFLSLVPIPAKDGWLFEDMVRGGSAPNGTSELLIDSAMRDLARGGCQLATLGLAPLGPESPSWARLLGWLGRPLYDFRGVRAFKQRLHPSSWQRVYLAHGPGMRVLHVVDSLRAFAGGSLVRFGLRTLVQAPSALPWALALPLVPWALLLAVLAAFGGAGLLGFGTGALLGWAAFDALLAAALFRAARHPRRSRLAQLSALAALDGAASAAHLATVGFGASATGIVLRCLATAAPVVGCLCLAFAAWRAR